MQRILPTAVVFLALSIVGVSSQTTRVSLGTSVPENRELICIVENLVGQQTRLSDAVFYLNGMDVRMNLTSGEYTEGNGEITFLMRPELEGEYTCYAGGSCPGVCQSLAVVGKIVTVDLHTLHA